MCAEYQRLQEAARDVDREIRELQENARVCSASELAALEGRLDGSGGTVTYRRDGKALAVAVVHRDLEGLRAELQFERAMASAGNRVPA